ncbi:MAG: hypothetical protein ACI9LO_002840, partial [Planctomycetota bacterium]
MKLSLRNISFSVALATAGQLTQSAMAADVRITPLGSM